MMRNRELDGDTGRCGTGIASVEFVVRICRLLADKSIDLFIEWLLVRAGAFLNVSLVLSSGLPTKFSCLSLLDELEVNIVVLGVAARFSSSC